MELYKTSSLPQKQRLIHDGEKLFLKQVDESFEGYRVLVDGIHDDVPMIIRQHTNPLNKNKHDMRAKYLNSTGDFLHIGNTVSIPQMNKSYKDYIAITEPSSNGIYSEYKILPLSDDIKFDVDVPISTKCIVAHKGLYDEISYVNDTNVFEDKDTRAVIVQYNNNTSKLSLFDDLLVNDERYKIVKIDTQFKEYNQDFGVMQLVMVDTPFGEIKVNDTDVLKGIVMTARVKDKILNSISRELLCYHDKVKRGDYIDFTYDRDKQGKIITEKYLINNKPTMGSGYDKSLMCLCESRMNLLNNEGDIVNVGVYFENNRMRIDRTTEGEFAKFANSSFMILVQNNDTTSRISTKDKYNRVIVDGKPYEVSGVDDSSKGILYIGLNNSQFDPNDDDIEKGIANYKSQMEAIKGDKPTPPTSQILGSDVVTKGYNEEYYLQGASNTIVWSVDCSYIAINQDGTKCTLYFNTLGDVNKTFTLSARYMGTTFTKTIKTVKI